MHFASSFQLGGIEGRQPPGDYQVDHDEEMMEGLSWIAYRRVATYLHLPAKSESAMTRELIAVDHDELEAALAKDQAAS